MAFDDNSTVPPFPEDEMPTDGMGFDDDTTALGGEEPFGEAPGGPPDNKTFIFAVAGLIGFLVLAMMLMAAYAFFVVPRQKKARATQAAQINAQNTAVAQALTATAAAARWTATPTRTPVPTATPTPVGTTPAPAAATPTPVVAQASPTPAAMINATAFALTATSIALTSAAAVPSVQPTSLAQTGFADQVGLPGLLALAVLLIVVIFLARRLRQSV
jgi:flagellar biogenesis protein FliO